MWKIFPATLIEDKDGKRKVPLIKGWQNSATENQEEHKLWIEIYKSRLTFFGIPTGTINGLLVLDVDVKGNGFETLKNYEIPVTMSQKTPSGGVHFFFKYPNDGRVYGNRVKFLPGLDIRGEGGWVAYYGTDKNPIAEAPAWLLEQALKAEKQITGASVRLEPSIAEGIILKSLDAIRNAPEGESNNTLNVEAYKIGQLVAANSVTREYAEEALYRAAIDRGKPPYEAKATIKSGLDGGIKNPILSPFGEPIASFPLPAPPGLPARWTPTHFTKQDLLNQSNLRRPQLFQDWSTEDIHITTADGGTGKTTLKLYEAICLSLGERFLGFNSVQRGKTLFITGEDTDKKLGAMIGQIARHMGLFEDFPGNDEKIKTILDSVIVKKDADLCLISKDKSGFITPNAEAMRKVLEAVEDIKPKMIVFDPISSFWGSESALNDMNKAVTKFMSELAERSGACVEMINHMGKSSSANKDMSQFAGRGGSGLPSNARVSRVLRSVFEEEYMELTGEPLPDRITAMMCMVNKFTDGSPLYNKPFLILRDGFLFSRKSLTPQKEKEAEQKLTDLERVFAFVKTARNEDKYPSQGVVIAHFMNCGNPLSEARVKSALRLLQYQGHMGEMIKAIENPDQTQKERVYVITDSSGREI
jgi:RecA-family ATPase